jgi:vacuolar-type H+-ATPase subunit I/STV1
VKNILTNIYDSIHKFIETINFNERLPNNHSFCSTALNSPYVSVFDSTTNKVNKERKSYLFRKLVDKSITRIKQIFNNNKKKIREKQRKLIEEELNEYVNIHQIITNEKYRKNILSNINLVSYNKKDLILKTWEEIKNNPIFNKIKERTFEDEMDDFFINE